MIDLETLRAKSNIKKRTITKNELKQYKTNTEYSPQLLINYYHKEGIAVFPEKSQINIHTIPNKWMDNNTIQQLINDNKISKKTTKKMYIVLKSFCLNDQKQIIKDKQKLTNYIK